MPIPFARTQTAFTLTEVIVATMIFALSAAGLLSVVSALTRPAAVSTREMTATLVGKGFLDELRQDVDAETWSPSSGSLSLGDHINVPDTVIGNITYKTQYHVTTDDPTGGRNVDLTVSWDE